MLTVPPKVWNATVWPPRLSCSGHIQVAKRRRHV